MLRITTAQINPTVGDIPGNIALMVEAARSAREAGSDLVVFPELSLTGYYPGDLLREAAFLAEVDEGIGKLRQLSRETPGLHWVLGAPTRREGPGKPLENSLLVVREGEVLLRYAKQLLPTYDVFDERRHFEPGPDVARVLRVKDTRIGFLVCEDSWNDPGEAYTLNPFHRLQDAAPDLVVSINASPSNLGKLAQRQQLMAASSRRHGLPLLYVNQVGGQDQVVYDGASFAVCPSEGLVVQGSSFREELIHLAFDQGRFLAPATGSVPAPEGSEFYRRQIVLGLRDYARRCGFKGALVGSSGGIDSALTLALAAEALGSGNVVALTMPSRYSSSGSVSDSEQLCLNLGIPLHTHPIGPLVDLYSTNFAEAFGAPLQGTALENLQARIRGTILMEYSNAFGYLLLTTGNKSEISVGYCTLYGDTNGGLGLIGDLYKTEVYALASHLNSSAGREIIPVAVLEKAPSAELAPDQRDTDSLPPYPVLDDLLKSILEGDLLRGSEQAQVEARMAELASTPEGIALVTKIKGMIARNEYKRRQAPPILRLRPRAFGSGRQLPIAARHIL
nr:NAD+ synthase [uncultured Holophaga sp.]